MALAALLFDSVSLAPYGFDLQPGNPGQIATSARRTLGGTWVFGYSNCIESYDLRATGIMSKAKFDSLRAKLDFTSHTLVTSEGSCSAVMVVCSVISDLPGDPGSSGHLVMVSIAFVKTSAFS